jgi:hypothetical protein
VPGQACARGVPSADIFAAPSAGYFCERSPVLVEPGVLACKGLPTKHRDIDIGRIDLDREAGAAGHLGRDYGSARTAEGLIHGLSGRRVVFDWPAHAANVVQKSGGKEQFLIVLQLAVRREDGAKVVCAVEAVKQIKRLIKDLVRTVDALVAAKNRPRANADDLDTRGRNLMITIASLEDRLDCIEKVRSREYGAHANLTAHVARLRFTWRCDAGEVFRVV